MSTTEVDEKPQNSRGTGGKRPGTALTLDIIGLLARLSLGGVLLVAGYIKAVDFDASVRSVVAYDLFDFRVAEFIGITLPIIEIAVGLTLILGLFTRLSGALGALLMVIFIAGIASAWARGLSIDCGCFGTGGPVDPSATRYLEEIIRDIALGLAGLWLVVRPHTLFAVDGLLGRRAPDERND
ncbi:MAG: DoxX family protein [Ornithinimicrobium sp.]